ncbi:MAG: hypothetical protein V1725_01555 [archaeon]
MRRSIMFGMLGMVLLICSGIVLASWLEDRTSEYRTNSEYQWQVASTSTGYWDFLTPWDPKYDERGDPRNYNFGWYPLHDWEYEVCLRDFSPEVKQTFRRSYDPYNRVYDLTVQANAFKKNITLLNADNVTVDWTFEYVYEWYVQPTTGRASYAVFKVRDDGARENIAIDRSADYVSGSAGYIAEYSQSNYTQLVVQTNGADAMVVPVVVR